MARPFAAASVARRTDSTVARVRAVSLRTLLEPLDHVDLIDADIRGAEQTRSSPQLIS